MNLLTYILRRLVLTVPLLIGITLISFAISHAVPGDPITANLGQKAMSDPKIVAAFRAEWGLDKPVPEQYLIYLRNLLRGDLGDSIRSRRPVVEDLSQYLPATIELATAAVVFGVATGIFFGIVSAVRRNSWIDHVVRFVSLLGVSVPVFWLALVMLYIFYARLGWAAGPGRLDAGMDPPTRLSGFYTLDALLTGNFAMFGTAVRHLALPALVLGSYTTGLITRVTRSSMLEVLGQSYVRVAQAKGLREYTVVVRHALRNALIPILTVIGSSYGGLLAGAVLTENIFAWPGIGQYAFRSSTSLDFPAIMGVSLLIALIFIVANLIVDLLYFVLDPRLSAS